MASRYQALCDYIDNLPIISTHEHHTAFPPENILTIESLMNASYIGWCGVSTDDRSRFLDLVSGNSYFIWYEKALDDLFDFGGEITAKNWDEVSAKIGEALNKKEFHEMVFLEKCRYKKAILDVYWKPGYDNDHPDLYSPTFRINSFLYGWNQTSADHNGNNAQLQYGKCSDLDEYLAMMESRIAAEKENGSVALKSALAYDRQLRFLSREKSEAARIFNKPECTPEEEVIFEDFIFDQICTLAAKHNLPFQNHVGLGKLPGSNPMNLVPMIERHPDTKFVLFHMGYPWIEEVCALSHNYPNVYPDLCWMPSIGTTACARAIHAAIETARDSSRLCWGGDSWIVTESYGASLAMRSVLKDVLCSKVESGYLTEDRARRWAERILHENASELYSI